MQQEKLDDYCVVPFIKVQKEAKRIDGVRNQGSVTFLDGDERGHRDSGVLAAHVQFYDVELMIWDCSIGENQSSRVLMISALSSMYVLI